MIDIWGADEQPEPAPERAAQASSPVRLEELSQTDVDSVIIDERAVATPDEPVPAPPLLTPASTALVEPPNDLGFIDIESPDDFGFIDTPRALPPPRPETPAGKLMVVEQARPAPPSLAMSRFDAFADIEGLDTREKLRRFT
jgi:hypothetical protein